MTAMAMRPRVNAARSKTSKRKAPQKKTRNTPAEFTDAAVKAIYSAYPKPLKTKLLALRRLIFDIARTTQGVGTLEETLKWGQPSYLTPETGSGTTVRIDQVKSTAGQYAVYFHCQTDLVETFRGLYPTELNYGGNRSILLSAADDMPEAELRHCIGLALTYHLNKRKAARAVYKTESWRIASP